MHDYHDGRFGEETPSSEYCSNLQYAPSSKIAAERFLLLSSNMLSNADWGIALNAPDSLGRPSLCEKWIGSGSRRSKVPYSLTKSLC